MVHLAPDSRLLVSLVKQEQTYATQLHNLLNASGASLSALSIYASSSPPTVSPILNGVAGALSGADEALRTYGEALNDWVDQLGSIKHKEEEVANIGRDREILVTRLLKVSKKSKSPPPSLLHAAPDPSSSSSFPTFSSKITAAQTELQACESHLAEKERDLERTRTNAIRQGLKVRCTALVQCGWVWGEMGRRALAMLDGIESAQPPSNGHVPEFFKPLPDPTRDNDHDSLLSSLSPSQSASQIGVFPPPVAPTSEKPYRIDVPPPHLVTENVIPGSTSYPSPLRSEPDGNNSSSEDEGPVEVHENPKFQPPSILNKRSTNIGTAPSTPARGSPVPFPIPSKNRGASSDIGPPSHATKVKREREKKHTGFLGSLASLFRTSMTSKPGPQSDARWDTRTDQNLRGVKSDGEQSSDEEVRPRTGRLRKARGRTANESLNGWADPSMTGTSSSPPSMPSPPAGPTTVKKKKSWGGLGRTGTVRSTISEPAPAPRARATTLSSSSPRPAVQPSAQATPHQRRGASMDGRWGLSDQVSSSATSLQTVSPTSAPHWKSAKPAPAGKGDSLMSIVEGVTRSNQDAWSYAHDDPSSRLKVVRAPGSSVPHLPLLVHPPPPLPGLATAPTSPTISKSAAPKRASMPASSTPGLLVQPVAEKKPLRSALRNSSRERSASPSPAASPARPVDSEVPPTPSGLSPLSSPSSSSPSLRPMSMSRTGVPSTIIESPRQSMVDTTPTQRESYVSNQTDDSASISSYETGHENFDNETDEEPSTPVAPPPPPASEKVSPPPTAVARGSPEGTAIGTTDQHEMSSATSTETAGSAPARRKSVRMSTLPPQISATPPALDEYEDESRSPWGPTKTRATQRDEGWNTRAPKTNIGWDDSSDEDEEYRVARQALSRADRRLEKSKR